MNTAYTPNLLSDASERVYALTMLAEARPLSLKKGLAAAGRTLLKGAKAFSNGVAAVINAQAEARARSMHYTRSPW